MKLILPIYYTFKFKRKDDKTILLSTNWYRNAFHFTQNKVKHDFHELVKEQIGQLVEKKDFSGCYTLSIDVYYKNTGCDGSNVAALIEKFTLDALQTCKVVVNDNVKYHLGTTWRVAGQDKENPRCVVTIHPTERDCDV